MNFKKLFLAIFMIILLLTSQGQAKNFKSWIKK